MKSEDKKTLYIVIAMILFLGIMTFWRIKSFEKPQIKVPISDKKNIEIPSFSDFFSEENIKNIMEESGITLEENEKEIKYIREKVDNVLIFDYPSSWEKVPSDNLENFSDKIETLFVSYSQASFYPKNIAVLKIEAGNTEDLSLILTENFNIDVVIKEEENYEYLVEINESTSSGNGSTYLSKAFFLDNYYYFFIINYFEEESVNPPIINYIFSSVQIIR